MSDDELPLSTADRILVHGLIGARARLAWSLSVLSGATAVPLVGWLLVRGVDAGDGGVMIAAGGASAVLAGLAWRLGWAPLRALQGDLADGRKQVVRGQVSWLDRRAGADGEVITHALVARAAVEEASAEAVSFVGRDERMASVQVGDAVKIELLPRSAVVVGGARA